MSPPMSREYVADRRCGDAVFSCDLSGRKPAHCVLLFNRADVSFTELCGTGSGAACLPLLAVSIGVVVGGRSKPQVLWVDALPVVARMANAHSDSDRSDMQLKGKAMALDHLSSDNDGGVTLWRQSAGPVPARIDHVSSADISPKAIDYAHPLNGRLTKMHMRRANAGSLKTRPLHEHASRNRADEKLVCESTCLNNASFASQSRAIRGRSLPCPARGRIKGYVHKIQESLCYSAVIHAVSPPTARRGQMPGERFQRCPASPILSQIPNNVERASRARCRD